MTSESIGPESPEPGEAFPAAHDTLGEFLVIVATGDDPVLAKMFVAVIEESLPGAKIRVVAAEARSIADLARMPEFRQAGLALVTFMTLHELPGSGAEGRGKAANVEASIRHLREHTEAFLLVTSGWFNPAVLQGIARGGADDFLAHPFKCRELTEIVEKAYKRWVEKRQKQIKSAGPSKPNMRTRTILLGDDHFSDLWQDVIAAEFADVCDVCFIRFKSEGQLLELLETGCADLVMLYIGNVTWNADHADCRKGISFEALKDRFRCAIDILGELSTRHRVPVIATQGTDLRAEATRAGIHFLEAPFKLADLLPVVHAALGIKPPPDPAPAP